MGLEHEAAIGPAAGCVKLRGSIVTDARGRRSPGVAIVPHGDYNADMEPSFEQMTQAERILYVQDLWDRIAADAADSPLTPAQAAEIDRRLDDHRKHPETSIPWEVTREQIRRRR